MSIKEAKKILKLWVPIIKVPAKDMDTSEKRTKAMSDFSKYAKKLNQLTGNYVFIEADEGVQDPTINWPLKTYSQEVVLNWE